MIKINFEFRKGIFFIRLIGNLNKESYKQVEIELNSLINDNQFKYIVINTNYLKTIDLTGLNYLTQIYFMTITNKSNLVICDKSKRINTLFNNNVPNIADELEVL